MSKELHITLIGPTRPFRGGIAHHTTLLARTLGKRHPVRFFSYSRQYPRWLYPGRTDREPGDAGEREPGVRYTLDSLNPRTWLETARHISAQRVDLLLVPWWTAYWALPVAFITRYVRKHTAARTIFLCHNISDHETSRVKDFIARTVLRSGDAFLVHSDEECEKLHRIFPRKTVRKIYHPTYEALIGAPPGESRLSEVPAILFFGFIRPYKGLDVLLGAMPEIHRRTGAVLKVVGEPWGEIRDILPVLDRQVDSGLVSCDLRYVPVEEIGKVFSAADLVVLPYRTATGCGVVQLAFGSGKPVVATDVGGLRDAVREGENGFLVKPGDEGALIEAVVKALSPSVYPRIAQGARRASGDFSWDGIADIIEQIVLPAPSNC